MATEYSTIAEIKVYKYRGKEPVATLKKGARILIVEIDGAFAKIDKSQAKLGTVTIANCYVSSSYIKKVTNKSPNKENKNHLSHDTNEYNGEIIIRAYGRSDCSKTSYQTTGKYFDKGTKVKIKQTCKTNNMTKVQGKSSAGKKETLWVESSSVKLSKSSLANIMKKAKDKVSATQDAQSRKAANKLVSSILDTNAVGKIDGDAYAEKLIVRTNNGIMGIPYQFMPSVDYRVTNKVSFGRKYVERIVTRMPIILFTPGRPDFMPNFTKTDRNTAIQALISTFGGSPKKKLNALLKSSGRYYTLDFAYASYWKFVNAECRFMSIVLGIGSVKHTNGGLVGDGFGTKKTDKPQPGAAKGKFKSYKWQKAVNKDFNNFLNCPEYIAFYLDSETSVNESMDNSTTSSSIAEAVNQASSLSKEIQFLAGPIAGLKIGSHTNEEGFEEAQNRIKEIADKHTFVGPLMGKLGEMFNTVSKGGKILFPELWDDSDYTKTYNISFKLRSPDGDKISIYLNILVPLAHIRSLAAPHSLGPNGYCAPFLVRCTYKGIFNIDMGLITSVDITKGKEGAWSIDGLPTEVDVSMTIKDLYGAMSITDTKGYKFFQNTALIDYLCTSCGVNINKIELARLGEAYIAWANNKYEDFFPSQWLKFQQGYSSLAGKAYSKIIKKNYN